MAGPWEKYQQAAQITSGPWSKYQSSSPASAASEAPEEIGTGHAALLGALQGGTFGFADELRKKTSGAAVRESLMLKLIVGLKKYD